MMSVLLTNARTWLFLLSSAVLLFAAQAVFAAAGDSYSSKNGRFLVSYQSQLNPVVINQIHAWQLHVTDADSQPVTGADIAVKGGMPAHNHGLATSPAIEPGDEGDYLLQGLRFHMMGYWELTLTINAGGIRDEVVIPLTL
jgi:hypothetical protein